MKTKLIIDRHTFLAKASMVCMFLAIVFRAVGTIGYFKNEQFMLMRFALPAFSCLLFIICIFLLGKKALWTTVVPVVFGIVFFIMRILSDDNITAAGVSTTHIALCIALYVLIAIAYACTVFGAIKTKLLLVIIFGLAFAYHVVVEDYRTITSIVVAPKTIFMELGVLFIILGLFFASLGMKKQTKASDEKTQDVAPPIPGGLTIPSDPEPSEEKVSETVEIIEAQDAPVEEIIVEKEETVPSDETETDK